MTVVFQCGTEQLMSPNLPYVDMCLSTITYTIILILSQTVHGPCNQRYYSVKMTELCFTNIYKEIKAFWPIFSYKWLS